MIQFSNSAFSAWVNKGRRESFSANEKLHLITQYTSLLLRGGELSTPSGDRISAVDVGTVSMILTCIDEIARAKDYADIVTATNRLESITGKRG